MTEGSKLIHAGMGGVSETRRGGAGRQMPAELTDRDVSLHDVAGKMMVPLVVVLALALSACTGSREVELPPDERFGHRFEETGPEGRRTVAIQPPDSAVSYFYYPVVFDTVHTRPAAFSVATASGGEVPVEVLVKGSLPDGCTELNDVTQERFGHIIQMEIDMRRPQGSVCTRVMRPYRFYVRLDGLYGPGSYTLKLNNRIFTFSIRQPEAG